MLNVKVNITRPVYYILNSFTVITYKNQNADLAEVNSHQKKKREDEEEEKRKTSTAWVT